VGVALEKAKRQKIKNKNIALKKDSKFFSTQIWQKIL